MNTTGHDAYPQPGTPEYDDLAHTGSAPPLAVETRERMQPGRRVSSTAVSKRRPHEGAPRAKSPLGLTKFVDRLTQPPVIRAWRRSFEQPVRIRAEQGTARFHAELPRTQAWTYEGSVPGPTIEVRTGKEVRIDWQNWLHDDNGGLGLPFDVVRVPPNLEAADVRRALEPGGRSTLRGAGPDAYPPLEHTEDVTAATVVHLHGALTNGHNDGWAHNVALPGETTRCAYPNRQSARTLWYHDHAMAVTRFNVHAGLAGFYLIRDEREDALCLPDGEHELLLAIADRNLETDEQGRFTGRLLYKQAGFTEKGNPGEIPFTGPFTMVNGTIWPTKNVEARWYRLRLLNASNSRVMRLALHDTSDEVLTGPVLPTAPEFTARRVRDALVVIGTDGGFLQAPAKPADGVIEMGPGERMDVLVDFGALRGRRLELRNENGTALNASPGQADATVMQFIVESGRTRERFSLPDIIDPAYSRWKHRSDGVLEVGGGRTVDHHGHAWIAVIPPRVRGSVHPEMWEMQQVEETAHAPDTVRLTRDDGSVVTLRPVAKLFDDTVTIRIAEKDWVVWNIIHLGGPDHPMHIHMTDFQLLSRKQWPLEGGRVAGFDMTSGSTPSPLPAPGPGRDVDEVTAGRKDTWVIKAGEWVTVLGEFAGATGSFMYHCHILDHEDHTMMRPFVVLPQGLLNLHAGHGPSHHSGSPSPAG